MHTNASRIIKSDDKLGKAPFEKLLILKGGLIASAHGS